MYGLQTGDAKECLELADSIKSYLALLSEAEQKAAGNALRIIFNRPKRLGVTADKVLDPLWRKELKTTLCDVQAKSVEIQQNALAKLKNASP
jgi:hypothetical protein